MRPKIIVIGAGIGGLCAAIAARRVGCEVEIFEKASGPNEIGAGIVLYPNALIALRKLGVFEPIAAAGAELRDGDYLTSTGRVLARLRVDHSDENMVSIAIHRADLQRALSVSAGSDAINFSKHLDNFSQTDGRVRATFKDGTFVEGDALIGADGLHSRSRELLLQDGPPRFANCVAWRGVCQPASQVIPDGVGLLMFGHAMQVGAMHIGKGQVYWFGALATDEPSHHARDRKTVLEIFGKWAHPVPELIASTADDAILCHDLYDRPPARYWGRDHATLLGDAAHPMTPFMGQGGCQAIEDAVALGAALKAVCNAAVPLGDALRGYEADRMARTAKFVLGSRNSQNLAMSRSPFISQLRDLVLPLIPRKVLVNQLHTLSNYQLPDL